MPTTPEVHDAVAIREDTAIAGSSPGDITALIQLALDRNVPVEALEKIVALHERVTDRANAAEFSRSLAEFQEQCPIIERKTEKKIATDSGGGYVIHYAELGQIAREIGPILKKCGLAYTWNTRVEDKLVNVTCILRHVNGHREAASFACPPTGTRAMSDPQKYASATTYAKRQSLLQVLGITTADPDTDGRDYEPITEDQVGELRRLADEVGADVVKFLGVVGVPTFEEIPADRFKMAKLLLQQRKAAPQGKPK